MQIDSSRNPALLAQAIETIHRPDIEEPLLTRREALLEELKELDATLSLVHQEYSAKLQDLQTRKKPIEEAIRHIEALLRFEGYTNTDQPGHDITRGEDMVAETSITHAAVGLLQELHQPLHYRDIVLKLQERNIYVPGKDPAATLLSRINRDNRFKRAAKRGVYGLSTWRMRSAKPRRTNRQRATK